MSDLKTALSEMGATKQQLSSPVVGLCEKALTEREDFVSEIAESRAKKIVERCSLAEKKLVEIGGRLGNLERATCSTITNGNVKDAVVAYRIVLETTKEVFGEQCTQDVIRQAIKSGSYIAWRGIMGSKWRE